MLEDVLQELNNWFLCPDGVHLGHYQVEDGSISLPFLSPGSISAFWAACSTMDCTSTLLPT